MHTRIAQPLAALSSTATVVSLAVAALLVWPGQSSAGNAANANAATEPANTQAMPRRMGRGPVGLLTQQDEHSAEDMGVTMNLVHANTVIDRTVTRLPNGITTLTESSDPGIAQDIQVHVARMTARLNEGQEFNLFSTTLPIIFDKASDITTVVDYTPGGARVTQTSADPVAVQALQAHADEVTELVKEGRAAFHRGLRARAAMGPDGPRGALAAPTHR
jgi:hypothetical protein